MAATSYSTLPPTTHVSLGSQGEVNRSTNYGSYDTGAGSVASHPYQYQTHNHKDHQNTFMTEQSQPIVNNNNNQQPLNANTSKMNPNKTNYGTTKMIQMPPKTILDSKHGEPKNPSQRARPDPIQPRPPAPVNSQHQQPNLVRSERQLSNRYSKQQQQKSQPPPPQKMHQSDPQLFKAHETPLSLHHESSSESYNNNVSEKTFKKSYPSQELRPTKSSSMRAAANKKSQEMHAQKRKNRFFPGKLKSQPTSPQTDFEESDYEKTLRDTKNFHPLSKGQKSSYSEGEQTDTERTPRTRQHTHSLRKHHKNHQDDNQIEDNNSSGDDENHPNKHPHNKSKKQATSSDPHLPPVRYNRHPHYYDPYLGHPVPIGHPLRGRYPYDGYPPFAHYPGRYSRRHLYEDADNIPPYLAPYHDPYDPFFDYQKRKAQANHREEHNGSGSNAHEGERDEGAKSQISRKSKKKNSTNDVSGRKSRHDLEEIRRSHWPEGYYPPNYFDGEDSLEVWRQERNNFLKRKFKPTIHDVLYSQQWMKSDSYLENQRRRALRDAQGFYFPYKKYTLKDYKDMQKANNQNPFADTNETTLDRRERARKRQEYGSLVERQMVDNPGTRYIPPREMPQRKPWHLNSGKIHDPNKATKRERAIEYAKEQVKYRPVKLTKHHSERSDQSVDNVFSEVNGDGSNTERTNKIHQSFNNNN